MPRTRTNKLAPDWSTLPIPGASRAAFRLALAEWREENGCTQVALARALGVARNTVVRWEMPPDSKGSRVPDERACERFEALRKGGPEAVKRLARKELAKKFA